MNNKQWSFLTNYWVVFAYIAKNPRSTTQNIAQATNLSIRGVNIIIDNLVQDGYITKVKEGRCNSYVVHPERSMQEKFAGDCTIGDMLKAFKFNGEKSRELDASYA
jgi:predicted transcriptional regulator